MNAEHTETPPPPQGARRMNAELVRVARLIEDMKQECGMDPESPTAIRNSRLMSIGAILRELANGAAVSSFDGTSPAACAPDVTGALPAHTPGPWSAYKDSCWKCEESGTQEWEVSGPPEGYHARFTKEADARLIATAPDLLHAARVAANVLFLLTDEVKRLGHSAENAHGLLRAAISKAEAA